MNHSIYEMYRETRELIKRAETSGCKDADKRQLMAQWQNAVEILEQSEPSYKEVYERRCAIQESFTPEQIDHICYMIGDWYIEWKDRIVMDINQGTHRLGFAKEQLKSLICGDG